MASVLLAWKDNSTTEEGQRVYRSNSPMIDGEILPPPLAELPPDVTTYTDRDVVDGAIYYYRVSSYIGEFEMVSSEIMIVAGDDVQGDLYWDNVVSLLHFDGDLVDETGRAWASYGDVELIPLAGFGYQGSARFNGGRIATNDSDDFDFSDGDFTIEFLYHFVSQNGQYDCILVKRQTGSFVYPFGIQYTQTGGRLSIGAATSSAGWAVSPNNSYVFIQPGSKVHLALVRHGNSLRLYVDGESVINAKLTGALLKNDKPITIGADGDGLWPSNCAIDELRITKGVARYTENFTPPNKPFPNHGPVGPLLPTERR